MAEDIWAQKARGVVEEWLGVVNHHHLNLRFEASDALQQILARELRAAAAGAGERMRERCAKWHDNMAQSAQENADYAKKMNWVGSNFADEAMLHRTQAAAIRALPLDEEAGR